LNEYIIKSLKEGVKPWGIAISRYEITDIIVSTEIREAMLRQASAERKRREDVLHAEALKR
jgi:regulator of protease activity HflC (stomatin/prohibitin superfamily)